MTLSSFCYILGYATGALAFFLMARRRGIATEGVMAILGAGLVGGLVCANLAQWLLTGQEGKTVIGGVAGGYLCVILYKRYLGITRPLGDLFAVGLSAGEAVGRWGCFFGGCCYGKATSVPWAIYQHGAWRHPTQIYASISSLAILLILLRFENLRVLPENGLFYWQGALFCVARFGIEFFRADSLPQYGLTLAQWACLAGFGFFAYKLSTLHRVRSVIVEAVSEVKNLPHPTSP